MIGFIKARSSRWQTSLKTAGKLAVITVGVVTYYTTADFIREKADPGRDIEVVGIMTMSMIGWFVLAQFGHTDSEYVLGMYYEAEMKDICRAAILFDRAARKGHTDAKRMLSVYNMRIFKNDPQDVEAREKAYLWAASARTEEATPAWMESNAKYTGGLSPDQMALLEERVKTWPSNEPLLKVAPCPGKYTIE